MGGDALSTPIERDPTMIEDRDDVLALHRLWRKYGSEEIVRALPAIAEAHQATFQALGPRPDDKDALSR